MSALPFEKKNLAHGERWKVVNRWTWLVAWMLLIGPLSAEVVQGVTEQDLQLKLQLVENVLGRLREEQLAVQIVEDVRLARELIAKQEFSRANTQLNAVLKELNRIASHQAEASRREKLNRQRYQALLTSIRSFQWPAEMRETEELKRVAANMKKMLEDAEKLSADGNVSSALELLLSANKVMVGAQVEMRQGRTVVYKLEFSDKPDEYAYELRRNENYELLLQMTLEQQQFTQQQEQLIYQYVERSAKVRVNAEREADRGSWDDAISTMEQSSILLERALRLAGLPLP
jgi:hypothetical protein